jgi:hypothetical protein
VNELEGGFSNPPSIVKNMRGDATLDSMKLDIRSKRHSEEVSPFSGFFNPYAPIQQHKHRLPHWQQGSVYYFVTWRLADSLPREKLARWSGERNLWLLRNPPPWNTETEAEYHETFSQVIDDWLDAGAGSCLLADPQLARCVADALLHYDDER